MYGTLCNGNKENRTVNGKRLWQEKLAVYLNLFKDNLSIIPAYNFCYTLFGCLIFIYVGIGFLH